MSTKYIKVAVSEEKPKEKTYVGIINTLGDIDNLFHIADGRFSTNHVGYLAFGKNRSHEVAYWLKEIPDNEESLRQRNKELVDMLIDETSTDIDQIQVFIDELFGESELKNTMQKVLNQKKGLLTELLNKVK